jgi:hypothetical protein
LGEAAFLGSGDRTMLGTVESKRSPPQEPDGQPEGDRQTGDQREAMREKGEQERSADRRREQQPFARFCDSAAAKER